MLLPCTATPRPPSTVFHLKNLITYFSLALLFSSFSPPPTSPPAPVPRSSSPPDSLILPLPSLPQAPLSLSSFCPLLIIPPIASLLSFSAFSTTTIPMLAPTNSPKKFLNTSLAIHSLLFSKKKSPSEPAPQPTTHCTLSLGDQYTPSRPSMRAPPLAHIRITPPLIPIHIHILPTHILIRSRMTTHGHEEKTNSKNSPPRGVLDFLELRR
ncbi:unnamed protein product [Tuber aestivum]|uniref:Uncharacterized protein n=1 Tax=Tuber aestivum TaxID=59557 RepID=A0A292PUY4_9PEZI|nr:unnamed protein product [Tuber aestivum]